jgi:dimeric dUTPase (all-alpha-NTP-PPase superfamily)
MTIPSLELIQTPEFQQNARELVLQMLENQQQLNLKAYSTEWFEKGTAREFHYPVAATQEIAEFINSYWLPWWSKAEQDMVNCRIEIVDAMHFMLSQAIIDMKGSLPMAADWIAASLIEAIEVYHHFSASGEDTLEFARLLQASLNTDSEHVFIDLFLLSYSIGFNIDQLHALYMGKSILNQFRQDNGYRQGNYKKKWDGVREDNHFMAEWVSQQTEQLTGDAIRTYLETTYAQYK